LYKTISDVGKTGVLSNEVVEKLKADLASMSKDSSPELQDTAQTLSKLLS